MDTLTGSDIAKFLGKSLNGESLSIDGPATLKDCGPGHIVWTKHFSEQLVQRLETRRPALVICDDETSRKISIPYIRSDNPRLEFIKILNNFFKMPVDRLIHPTAIIKEGAKVGENVKIGAYVVIDKNIKVGNDCIIGPGVKLEGDITIGKGCVIKSNSALGGQGFGFEYDEKGNPIHFPHLGKIVLEDEVWIGSCSTVEIGTLGETRICTGSKIDDLVQVGHNVTVGSNTLIMAGSIICGGATIGEKCWIAPNSVIKEKVRIGNRVKVGLGAVVIRDIQDDLIVAGVPAKPLHPK